MLTYTPQAKLTSTEYRREYPWALLLMVFAWLWPGVFSHDLWNPSEPKLYTVIEAFSQNPQWQPLFFGEPYFQAAPIYVWVAGLMQTIWTPWAMEQYAAARMASILFTVIGLLGSGMAAYRLLGKHQGRSAVLILIGSIGLLPIAHFINSSSVLFAALGLIWWSFSISQKQLVFASLLNALGLVLLAQSAGMLLPIWVFAIGLFLMLNPLWRSGRLALFLLGSLFITLPLIAIYPITLAIKYPHYFNLYWQQHLFGVFGGTANLKFSFSLPYYLQHFWWFTIPAWPLALWSIIKTSLWQTRYGVISAIWLASTLFLLAIIPERDQDWLLFSLFPCAILGAAQLDSLRRGVASFLNWFGAMFFGLAALFLWIGFIAMNFGFPAKLAERAAYFSPYYTKDIDFLPITFAIIFTLVWIKAINRRRIRGRQAVTNWAAGITLVWALLLTLFLPWIDAAKSYRPIVQQMQKRLPENLQTALKQQQLCISVNPKDYVTRIAWQQYSKLKLSTQQHCRLQLMQYNPRTQQLPTSATVIWESRRPRNKNEHFVLLDLTSQTSQY